MSDFTDKNCPAALGKPKSTKPPYDNSYITQCSRLLKELEIKKQASTFYLREHLGIVHPAGRIKDLRKKYNILTYRTYEPDKNGVMHRIALYVYLGLKQNIGSNQNVTD